MKFKYLLGLMAAGTVIGCSTLVLYPQIMGPLLRHNFVVSGQSGSPSVGNQYELDVANGSGGWLDSGCSILPALPYQVNCQTFTYTNTEHSLGGWQFFPDSHWSNTPVSTYPVDGFYTTTFQTRYSVSPLTITGASWATGVATFTVASTSSLAATNGIQIIGVNPTGYNNSSATPFYGVASVVDSTHFTVSLASNPGTYVSGGQVWRTGGESTVDTGNRVKVAGGMTINTATNATATPQWNAQSPWESDFGTPTLGSFPISGTMNLEASGPSGLNTQYTVSQSTNCILAGLDCHLLVLNTDSGILYEGFASQTNSAPYEFNSVAVWNTRTNALRSNYTNWVYPPAGDTTGLTAADLAGTPIAPLVLTHAELYSGSPVNHPIRITLPQGSCASAGFTWPATHASTNNCTPTGVRMILPSTYSATCQHFDQIGLAFSSYTPAATLITTLQTYGAIFVDFGGEGYLTADSDSNWAGCNATGCVTTDYNTINLWSHCILVSDFQIVHQYPTQGINSGAVR